MTQQQPTVDEIFDKAICLNPGAERERFLQESCGDDTELRARVEKLLDALSNAGSFLESPAIDPEATQLLAGVSETVGTTIGPYKLLEQIGEGGMGVVFRAAQSDAPPVARIARPPRAGQAPLLCRLYSIRSCKTDGSVTSNCRQALGLREKLAVCGIEFHNTLNNLFNFFRNRGEFSARRSH